MNLFLCIVWSCIGAALIVYHGTTTDPRGRLFMFPGEPSGGWLALILAAYNYVRWWGVESARRERQRVQMLEAERRERLYREKQRRDGVDPDPNFQFDDERSARNPDDKT